MIQTRPLAVVGGLGSIRTGSLAFFARQSAGVLLLVALDQLLNDRLDRLLRRDVGDESLRPVAGGVRRRALIRLLLAQLAPDLGPLDRDALDVVACRPARRTRGNSRPCTSVLGTNCQKIRAKPPIRSSQSQGGVGDPPEPFGLRPLFAGAGAGLPVAAVDSPCDLTQFRAIEFARRPRRGAASALADRTTAAKELYRRFIKSSGGLPSAARIDARDPELRCMHDSVAIRPFNPANATSRRLSGGPSRLDGFEPFLAVDRRRAARAGGGDRLAVVGVDDVAAGEDPLDVRGRPVVGQACRASPAAASIPFQASAVRFRR